MMCDLYGANPSDKTLNQLRVDMFLRKSEMPPTKDARNVPRRTDMHQQQSHFESSVLFLQNVFYAIILYL